MAMFAIERQQKIKDMLMKEKRVDVLQLSRMFSVSEVTIRRDLEKFSKDGLVIKTYGGAVLNEEGDLLPDPAVIRENSDNGTKEDNKMIGRIAADMIEPGEAVFLTPGATCLEIAKNMYNKKATVVTNDLNIGMALKDFAGIKTIVTGGDLLQSTGILVGHFAQEILKGIFINKAFIAVKGVNIESGYTLDSYDESVIVKTVIEISKETIIVADQSKFGKTAFAGLGDLTMAKKVITNRQVSAEYKRFFFEHAVKLYTTYEFE
jgi:DeoR family transcriptional regulator, fructose operon transcriptional repressor